MYQALAELLGAGRYLDRMACLTYDPLIVTVYVVAGTITVVSLLIVANCLWRHRFDDNFRLTFAERMTMACLLGLMALTYFLDVVLIFEGLYRLDAAIRGLVAGAAGGVAISVFRRCAAAR